MLLDGEWERKNGEKNRQVCPQQKLLAFFAGDQIRLDRRIKSPSVSWALDALLAFFFARAQSGRNAICKLAMKWYPMRMCTR